MRIRAISAVALAALALTSPVSAAQNGRGGGSPTHGPKAQAQTIPPAPHGNAPAPTHSATKTTPAKPPTKSTPTRTTKTTSTKTTPTTLNPIAQKLQGKPLGARLERMLPTGMTLDAASTGFKNQGQFIAALHVSQNLGIPFADLKAAMLGSTTAGGVTTAPMSLGQAIQRLRPTVDAGTAIRRAERDADDDVRATSSTRPTSKKPRG